MIKLILFFFVFFFINPIFSQESTTENNFECLTETRVSGLFQFQRKFLKETEFFPHKTVFNFSKKFSLLTEKESTKEKKFEAKYKFECIKSEELNLIECTPTDKNNTYNIKFSLASLRYRKTLITDYWINGKGNEVDYVHIAHGYCYIID